MIKYYDSGNLAIVDGYKFRKDKRTGYFLSSSNIGEKRKRLHVYMWEKENGAVPSGCSVHHIDENKDNNELSNLTVMTSAQHSSMHSKEYTSKHYDKVRDNMINVAGVAAKDWHRSEAGREWHRKHYERNKDKLHEKKTQKCEHCGKTFETTGHRTKYCSSACKSAARRASGIDDVPKLCEICGAVFAANRYQQTKRCPVCRSQGRRKSRSG